MDAVQLILKRPAVVEQIDWHFAIKTCIVHSRTEILERVLKFLKNRFKIEFQKIPLELCAKFAGLAYYEMVLNSNIFHVLSTNLIEACKYGPEYVQVVTKFFIENGLQHEIGWMVETELEQIMKLLLEGSVNGDKQCSKTALYFSFLCGLDKEFNELLNSEEWSDEELLRMLRKLKPVDINAKSKHLEVLKLFLNKLKSNSKFQIDSISLFAIRNPEYLKLILNDKHFENVQPMTNQFVLENFPLIRHLQSAEILISKCNLSSQTEFRPEKYGIDSKPIKTEFRNCGWLTCIGAYSEMHLDSPLENAQKLFEIDWNEELLDWTLKMMKNDGALKWFLKHNTMSRCWWNSAKFQLVLVKCCEYLMTKSLDRLLTLFPNFEDFSANNNEALRKLLTFPVNTVHSDGRPEKAVGRVDFIFKALEKGFRVKDEKERQDLIEFATERMHFKCAERISQIELFK